MGKREDGWDRNGALRLKTVLAIRTSRWQSILRAIALPGQEPELATNVRQEKISRYLTSRIT